MAGLLVGLVSGEPLGWTDDSARESLPMVKKVVNGMTFNVPEDWPIEERAGITAPIPIEEYIAQKLKAIEAKLQMLDQRLSGFDLRLRILEQGGSAGRGGGLRSAGQP